jgi:hypothetical protein
MIQGALRIFLAPGRAIDAAMTQEPKREGTCRTCDNRAADDHEFCADCRNDSNIW